MLEDSVVYSVNDFNTFRATFGLASQDSSGSMTQVHPARPGGACRDPGTNADDSESEIDAEWASAAAPDATIELASCANTGTPASKRCTQVVLSFQWPLMPSRSPQWAGTRRKNLDSEIHPIGGSADSGVCRPTGFREDRNETARMPPPPEGPLPPPCPAR
jgi:hypothetical protein